MERLSTGEKVVGGASLLLLILSFMPLWAKFEYEGGAEGFGDANQRFGGWSAATPFMAKLAFILALVALVLVVIRAMAVDINLPVPFGLAYLGLGALATLLLLITLLTGPVGDQGTESFGGASFEYSRGLAMLIGWIVAAAIAAGGYLHMQGETTAVGTGSPPLATGPSPAAGTTPTDPPPPAYGGTTPTDPPPPTV